MSQAEHLYLESWNLFQSLADYKARGFSLEEIMEVLRKEIVEGIKEGYLDFTEGFGVSKKDLSDLSHCQACGELLTEENHTSDDDCCDACEPNE